MVILDYIKNQYRKEEGRKIKGQAKALRFYNYPVQEDAKLDKKTLATTLFDLNRDLAIELLKFLLRKENQIHLFVLQNKWNQHYLDSEEPFSLNVLMTGNHRPDWTRRDFYHLRLLAEQDQL